MPSSPDACQLERLLAHRLEARVVPGLERIQEALAFLGHPEETFPSVLVLGTNGKGSTCAFLESLLRATGLRVGLYTSPHLLRVEERIRINGTPIPTHELLTWVQLLSRFSSLSYFETLTAAAFGYFAESRVAVAVVEAGLGGRWDATAAKTHEVALLTNVGTDHQSWLGPTRESIAAEKAAAIRGRVGILGEWDPVLLPVIQASANATTPLTPASQWAKVAVLSPENAWFPSIYASALGEQWEVTLPLAGKFQTQNYQLALAALAALVTFQLVPRLPVTSIVNATRNTIWPGRLELVNWRGRKLLLDGAHNKEAIEALVEAVKEAGLAGNIDLIFACLNDKPLAPMANLLRPVVCTTTVVPLASPRARSTEELAQAFPASRQAPDIGTALKQVSPERLTLVTGSLRLIGEVKMILEEQA